jgi:hypothetical protein
MVDITQAIQSLDSNAKFVINGTPTNEAEYQEQVKYVSGADENGTAIFSDTQTFTWSEVSAKQTELQAEYDANQYQRDRATAYPSIQEQLDMQYWDKVNGTTNWEDAIAKVKTDNPKS